MLARAWSAHSAIRDPEPAEDALIHTLDRAQAFSLLLAHILNNHGLVDYRLGRTTQAENAWRRSIVLYRELAPAGGASIGAPLANLSDLLRQRKRFAEAIGFATQALEVYDVGLGSNSSRSAQVLHLLGGTLIDCGEYRQARSVLTRALDITNHTVGPRHRQTGLIIASLAYLESRERNWSRSLDLYRDGIQIIEETSGPNHPELTTPLAGYSKVLRRLKRAGEARVIDQRRLAIRTLATAGALSTVSLRELNEERSPAK
jgi:tetratricopeptide (TPR) repeat protein